MQTSSKTGKFDATKCQNLNDDQYMLNNYFLIKLSMKETLIIIGGFMYFSKKISASILMMIPIIFYSGHLTASENRDSHASDIAKGGGGHHGGGHHGGHHGGGHHGGGHHGGGHHHDGHHYDRHHHDGWGYGDGFYFYYGYPQDYYYEEPYYYRQPKYERREEYEEIPYYEPEEQQENNQNSEQQDDLNQTPNTENE